MDAQRKAAAQRLAASASASADRDAPLAGTWTAPSASDPAASTGLVVGGAAPPPAAAADSGGATVAIRSQKHPGLNVEDSTWRSKAERAVARRNGEFIRYVWRKDGKGQDKADDGSLLWRRGR